jgi:hypothetical protein
MCWILRMRRRHSTRASPDSNSDEARILKSAPKIPEKSASILLSVNDKLCEWQFAQPMTTRMVS